MRYFLFSVLLTLGIFGMWIGFFYWMFVLENEPSIQIILALIVITLLGVWPETALATKRLRDMDEEPWLAILYILVPLFPCFGGISKLVMWIWLVFSEGTQGPNQYGPPPV